MKNFKYYLSGGLLAIIFFLLWLWRNYILSLPNQHEKEAANTVIFTVIWVGLALFLICYLIKCAVIFMSKHKSIPRVLFASFVSLLLIITGLFVFALNDKRDIAPVSNDSDLTLDSYFLEEKDNMYIDAVNMTNNLKVDLDDVNSNTEWGTNQSLKIDAINNILSDNKIVMENFENALNKKGYQAPGNKSNYKYTNDSYLHYEDPNMKALYMAAKLQQLKVELIREKRNSNDIDYEKSFEEALKILKLGDILTKSPLSPYDYRFALSIKKLGLEVVDTAAYNGTYDGEAYNGSEWRKSYYKDKAEKLIPYKDSNSGFSLAIKKTYTDSKTLYQKGWQSYFSEKGLTSERFGGVDLPFKLKRSDLSQFLGKEVNYYFKPQKTIALQAEIAREYLELPKEKCAEELPASTSEYTPVFGKLRSGNTRGLKTFLKENLEGEWAVDRLSGSFLEMNYRRCATEISFDGTMKSIVNYGNRETHIIRK